MFHLFVYIEVLGQIWEVLLDEIPIGDRLERTVAGEVVSRRLEQMSLHQGSSSWKISVLPPVKQDAFASYALSHSFEALPG